MTAIAGLIQKALLNIKSVKADLNSLLADLAGVGVKEIQALGASDYTKLVISLFKKHDFKEVFTSAASLLTETAETD